MDRRTWALGLMGLLAMPGCDRSDGDTWEGLRAERVTTARPGAEPGRQTGRTTVAGLGSAGGSQSPGPGQQGPTTYTNGPAALDGLPPIDLSARDRAQMKLSRRLEKRGLKRMREDRFDEATDRFFESIEVDPGNVNARYNFACALSRLGDAKAAVAMLDQLRDQGCTSCLGKVLKARRDEDFDPIRKHKAFVSVTADVELQLATPLLAATQIDAWVADAKREGVPLSIDPRRKIGVKVGCKHCTAGRAESGVVRGAAALRVWLERKRRAFSEGIGQTPTADCKAKCCTFAEPDRATVSPDMLFIAELCFRIEAGRVTSLSRLVLNRYPSNPSPL